jgi:hypothetical protein
MKIFYDCEFLEGTQKKLFGRSVPTIDLISIGMVNENDDSLYLISKEFNLKEAWNRYDLKTENSYGWPEGRKYKVYWIRENVLKPIFDYFIKLEKADNYRKSQLNVATKKVNENFSYRNFKKLLSKHGKTRNEIKFGITSFILDPKGLIYDKWLSGLDVYYSEITTKYSGSQIELYGYYSAYDHVCLSWIFGKMIDLPDPFPMYTKDLKQIFDEHFKDINPSMVEQIEKGNVVIFEDNNFYPINEGIHDALEDARWNKKLYEFLTKAL